MMSDESPAGAGVGGGDPSARRPPAVGGDDDFDQEAQASGPAPAVSSPGGGIPRDEEDDDLDDVPVTHDLPDPRSIPRTGPAVKVGSSRLDSDVVRRRKKKALIGAAALMGLCALVVVLVGFFGPEDAGKTLPGSAASSSSGVGGGGGTKGGSAPPDGGSSGGGGDEDGDEDLWEVGEPEDEGELIDSEALNAERLSQAREYILKYSVSTADSLSDPDSPQSRALEWIATVDPLRIAIPFHMGNSEEDVWSTTNWEQEKKFNQRYSLAVTYFALGGDGWKTSLNFLDGDVECQWNERYKTSDGKLVDLGASCDHPDVGDEGDEWEEWRPVTHIWTPWDHGLSGSLPPELRHLPSLSSLSMAYQDIDGPIPPEVCSLTKLEELSLSNNAITDSLPSCLDDMTSLRILALDDNLMTGDLGVLDRMGGMEFLYLEDNGFQHTLDENFLKDSTGLIHLDLSDNTLDGILPSHLLNHPGLRVLDLHDNELTGPLPTVEKGQDTLQFLALHKNELSGALEPSLGNLKELVYLDLAHNQFTGELAEEAARGIGTITKLRYLFIGGNNYSEAPFPAFLEGLTSLLELSLKDSSIVGPIPDWIGELTELYLLDLDGNKLTGSIPPSVGNLTDMMYLLLNRNGLNGTVPAEMGGLEHLRVVLLDDNSLTGSLDESLCPAFSDSTAAGAGADDAGDGDGGGGREFSVSADCAGSAPEIACDSSCCDICCEDAGEPCNDDKWIANNDPIWEHRYGRYRFEFEDEAN